MLRLELLQGPRTDVLKELGRIHEWWNQEALEKCPGRGWFHILATDQQAHPQGFPCSRFAAPNSTQKALRELWRPQIARATYDNAIPANPSDLAHRAVYLP